MKRSTVNVIEFGSEKTDILSLHSWDDTPEGNQEAETRFKACLLENGGGRDDADGSEDEETIAATIEDGYYESGDYTLLLTHST